MRRARAEGAAVWGVREALGGSGAGCCVDWIRREGRGGLGQPPGSPP